MTLDETWNGSGVKFTEFKLNLSEPLTFREPPLRTDFQIGGKSIAHILKSHPDQLRVPDRNGVLHIIDI